MIRATLAAALVSAAIALFGVALDVENRRRFVERATSTGNEARRAPNSRRTPRRALVVVAAFAGALIGAFVGGPAVGVAVGVAGALGPVVADRRRARRRRSELEEQLHGAVTAIASAIRAGRSLGQALVLAADEADQPVDALLRDAAHDAALGVPMDEILDRFADAVGGSDVRLVTGVLKLHRRTGGALVTALDDVARTLRARREGARELRSLTAQARLSAAILGLLPLGFFLFLSVVARRDVEGAYRTAAGSSAIGVGLALQGAAFVWIRRLLRVENA